MEKTVEVKDLLSELLGKMGFTYSKITTTEEDGNIVRANIESEEAPLLIGAQGRNLEALQHLAKNLLWKKFPDETIFLVVDIEGFKTRKQEQIMEMAKEKAEAVRATKITQILPPLNPFLRRLVHLELAKDEYSDLTTDSVGEEGFRRVRIIWKGSAKASSDLDMDSIDI